VVNSNAVLLSDYHHLFRKERARLRLTNGHLPNPAFTGGEKPGHVYAQPISASRPETTYKNYLWSRGRVNNSAFGNMVSPYLLSPLASFLVKTWPLTIVKVFGPTRVICFSPLTTSHLLEDEWTRETEELNGLSDLPSPGVIVGRLTPPTPAFCLSTTALDLDTDRDSARVHAASRN